MNGVGMVLFQKTQKYIIHRVNGQLGFAAVDAQTTQKNGQIRFSSLTEFRRKIVQDKKVAG